MSFQVQLDASGQSFGDRFFHLRNLNNRNLSRLILRQSVTTHPATSQRLTRNQPASGPRRQPELCQQAAGVTGQDVHDGVAIVADAVGMGSRGHAGDVDSRRRNSSTLCGCIAHWATDHRRQRLFSRAVTAFRLPLSEWYHSRGQVR